MSAGVRRHNERLRETNARLMRMIGLADTMVAVVNQTRVPEDQALASKLVRAVKAYELERKLLT